MEDAPEFKQVPYPPEKGIILVCGKCGKEGSRQLRQDLKEALKGAGRKSDYRVVLSSCLDICPKKGIAVATADSSGIRFFVASKNQQVKLEKLLPSERRLNH